MTWTPDGQPIGTNARSCTYELGDHVAAAEELEPIVDAEPGHVASRLLLARAYFHSARLTKAETQLREVIERAPDEAYAYPCWAVCCNARAGTTRRPGAAPGGDDEPGLRPGMNPDQRTLTGCGSQQIP